MNNGEYVSAGIDSPLLKKMPPFVSPDNRVISKRLCAADSGSVVGLVDTVESVVTSLYTRSFGKTKEYAELVLLRVLDMEEAAEPEGLKTKATLLSLLITAKIKNSKRL